MLRVMLGLAALAACATVVLAQNTAAISARKDAMKALGGATKDPGAMAKGESPFDLSKVQAALSAIETNATKAKTLFPADSKDGDTAALPVAFTDTADRNAKFDKMASDAKSARAAIKDEASFKTEWPKVVSSCGGCHKVYRKPPAAK